MTYSRLRTVTIENFQAITRTTFDLGNLTVLVGEGDVGKSSIIRAIRAAFLNDGDDLDIRHEQNKTTVTLEFEDGVVITWWKEKGKGGCYQMGEKYFLKTGNQVPAEVAAVFGIDVIEIDASTKLTPQLSDQHDNPFILWEPGSKRARIIGQATNLDVVVRAQMKCKKELDGYRRDATTSEEELAKLRDGLSKIPDLVSLEQRAGAAEETISLVLDISRRLARARELAEMLREVHSRVTGLDLAPLQKSLVSIDANMVMLKNGSDLAPRLAGLNKTLKTLKESRDDHAEALLSFTTQLEEACAEEGVCVICGGLEDHSECVS